MDIYEIGSLMVNREELLKTIYLMDEIAGHIAVLQDESSKLVNAGRSLVMTYNTILNNDTNGVHTSIERIKGIEEEIENLRRKITMDIYEIGSLMVNREELLKTIYLMDEIAGHMSGIAFRLSVLRADILKGIDKEVQSLLDLVLDEVFKLNEMARALSMNPMAVLEISPSVERLEKQIDDKYRALVVKVLSNLSDPKDLILLKDVLDGVEGMADKCLEVSDSMTILALNM
jgi:predicted phosphate transport protein (TIGR00153 family)